MPSLNDTQHDFLKGNTMFFFFLFFRTKSSLCSIAISTRFWSSSKQVIYLNVISRHKTYQRSRHSGLYRPPIKLQEGNVFSRVCLTFCPQGGRGLMWPLSMMNWTSLHRLFPSLVPLEDPLPHQYWYLVANETWYGWQAGGMHPTGMLCC